MHAKCEIHTRSYSQLEVPRKHHCFEMDEEISPEAGAAEVNSQEEIVELSSAESPAETQAQSSNTDGPEVKELMSYCMVFPLKKLIHIKGWGRSRRQGGRRDRGE